MRWDSHSLQLDKSNVCTGVYLRPGIRKEDNIDRDTEG